jgi:hypothetical protein
MGLTSEAQERQKQYLLTKGSSEEEAAKKVRKVNIQTERYSIKSYDVSTQNIYTDEITGEILTPPKEVPTHNLMFTSGNQMHFLYIPESSGHSILVSPSGNADASWINITFGRCRIK